MTNNDKFSLWLSSHPDPNEIARHLVEVSFAQYRSVSSRISKINNDGSLTFIGEFGHKEALLGKTYASEEWHQWRGDAARLALGIDSGNWNEQHKLVVAMLIDNGNVHGFVAVDFKETVDDTQEVVDMLRSMSYPLSLYLTGEQLIGNRAKDFAIGSASAGGAAAHDEAGQVRKQLTDRQIEVLKLVSQGKTNHEIAKQLGYSVSTIRHDVMHLFRVLRISARNEAGPRAAELAII